MKHTRFLTKTLYVPALLFLGACSCDDTIVKPTPPPAPPVAPVVVAPVVKPVVAVPLAKPTLAPAPVVKATPPPAPAPAPAPVPAAVPIPAAVPAPPPPPAPAPVVVPVVVPKPAPKPVPQYVISDINFEMNQSQVNADVERQMRNNVDWLAGNPGKVLVLEGHTDERGTPVFNKALGLKRAQQAKDFMVKLGADPSRIEVVSKGEAEPLDKGHNEAAWSKNRRVHVVVK